MCFHQQFLIALAQMEPQLVKTAASRFDKQARDPEKQQQSGFFTGSDEQLIQPACSQMSDRGLN